MPPVKLTTKIGRQSYFIGEWSPDWPTSSERVLSLRNVWSECMGYIQKHADGEMEKLRAGNRHRGPEGPSEMQARLRRTGHALKAVAAAEKRVTDMKAWLDQEAMNLPMLRPAPGDVGAAFVRREIRDRMAAMEPAELVGLLVEPSDETIMAALELPPELSKLNNETRVRLTRLSMERANPPARIEEISTVKAAIEVAENAVAAAHAAVRDGLTPTDERELAVLAGEAAA